MKDIELRGIVLDAFYQKRTSRQRHFCYEDFNLEISKTDFLRIADQLGEHGLLHWQPLLSSQGELDDGYAGITAEGVDAVESEGEDAPIRMQLPVMNVTVNNCNGVQVGNHNSLTLSVECLIREIEAADATPADKRAVKSALKTFLDHPLTSAILGGAVTEMIGKL